MSGVKKDTWFGDQPLATNGVVELAKVLGWHTLLLELGVGSEAEGYCL